MPAGAPDASAERRARELLASVAGPDALAMYEELGFLEVGAGEGYGYLLYPHRPIVAYDDSNGELLSEFCVGFPDGEGRLPDADDVLAKWMALRADERGLISAANMDRPGGQLDPGMVRRDLGDARAWREARTDA
jgi:hypothetical protein